MEKKVKEVKEVKKVEEVKEEKKAFDLELACTLWKSESKKETEYLKGYDLNDNKVIGFFNKSENEKQPAFKVYSLKENGDLDKEIITLWETTSLKGNLYLSGYDDDKKKMVGYYTNSENPKAPYIKIYFK